MSVLEAQAAVTAAEAKVEKQRAHLAGALDALAEAKAALEVAESESVTVASAGVAEVEA